MLVGLQKLSLKHWRYRLLHWTFSIRIDDWQKSPLPTYFYTHYCPLFHATNLLVLLIPFICAWKVFYAVLLFLLNLIPEGKHIDIMDLKRMISLIKQYEIYNNFDNFWLGHKHVCLKTNSNIEYWKDLHKQALALIKERKNKKKAMADRWVLFITASKFIFKWLFNILYVVVGIFLIMMLYYWGLPLLMYLGTINWFELLGQIFVWALMVCGIIFIISLIFRFNDKVGTTIHLAVEPCGNILLSIWNFFVVFYQGVCPPIEIIEDKKSSN